MKEFNPPPKEYVHWLSHKIYVAEKMTYSTGGGQSQHHLLCIIFYPSIFLLLYLTLYNLWS